jgi:hypothetical protein
MNATRRGISAHEVVETLETTRLRLHGVGVANLQADRVAVVLVMMLASPLCTAREACEAADRLFPPEVQP